MFAIYELESNTAIKWFLVILFCLVIFLADRHCLNTNTTYTQTYKSIILNFEGLKNENVR